MALEDFVELKLGHHTQDGIEVVDVEGEIDVYTAPGAAEALLDVVRLAVGEACSRAEAARRRYCPAEPVRIELTDLGGPPLSPLWGLAESGGVPLDAP